MTVTPLDAAQDVLDRARAMLALDAPPLATTVRTNIRRMSLVLGVAAVDTFMHWVVRRTDLDHLPGRGRMHKTRS